MAYTPYTWVDNVTDATAARLNQIEAGIATAQATADAAAAASPYASFTVHEVDGVLPARSAVGATATQSILVVSQQDPYAAGLGYLPYVDVWAQQQP